MKDNGIKMYKLFNTITFLAMVTVNALANILPINGIQTGAISDSYPNLFAPAGITFAIWGVIYLLLALFVLYQIGLFGGKGVQSTEIVKRIGAYFIISSLANTAWIFSWHYQIIPLSMVLMLVILLSLIMAYTKINSAPLTSGEKVFVRLPFSVYFGWITVATIANAVILLVSLAWTGFGISDEIWTIIVLITGLLIGTVTTLKNKDIAYGLVILWAYTGILIKHMSTDAFDGSYQGIIVTLIISLVLIVASIVLAGINVKKLKK